MLNPVWTSVAQMVPSDRCSYPESSLHSPTPRAERRSIPSQGRRKGAGTHAAADRLEAIGAAETTVTSVYDQTNGHSGCSQ